MLRSERWWRILIVGLILSIASTPAVEAQNRRRRGHGTQAEHPPPPPNAAAVASARAAYAEGQALFREGRFVESQARFESAFAAVPNPIVLLSIAETQERQENYAAAVLSLERYLRERTDAPDRESVQTRIAQFRSRPSRVHIMTAPSGAAISVDGQSTGRVSPTDLEMTPGDHSVAATLAHYDVARQSITTTFGARQELHLTLTPTPTRQPLPPPVEAEPVTPSVGIDPGEPVDSTPPAAGDELPPPVSDGPAASESSGGGNTAAWVFAGVSGAALVAGTVLGFMAMSEQSDFDAMPSIESADRGERFALLADVAFATAGAAAVTTLVLLLTHDDEAPPTADTARVRLQVSPSIGRHEGGVSARLTF